MTVKTLGAVAAAITILLLLVCTGALASCAAADVLPASCVAAPATDPTGGGGLGRYDSEPIGNVATIVAEGQARGVVRRGWVVAVATALQESYLRNLPDFGPDNDHDSIGLFQQRPPQGWGKPRQLADPAYQAGTFFDALLKVPGWQDMPLTQAAQAVQHSAHPDAYAAHENDAIALVAAIGGFMGQTSPGAACGAWTQPAHAPIVSGCRTTSRPDHHVDLGAARNTLIAAASAGTVIAAACNAHLDTTPYICDIDGHPTVSGCDPLTAPHTAPDLAQLERARGHDQVHGAAA